MKTCFVSMPVGRKSDPATGATIDFDRVYATLVVPAIEAAGLAALSWRSSAAGASIQKEALGHIISADVFLADVTTANPNVMYELGIRHAANRGPALLLRDGTRPPPFYAGYLQAVLYDPEHDLDDPAPLRVRLTEALRAAARRSEGSPVYEFFPGLRVELPEELRSEREQASDYPEVLKRVIEAASPDGLRTGGDAKHVQEWLASAGAPYPTAYLDVLRMFRDAGKHDELIAAYEAFPPDAANDPQALQLLALALNRRSREGDQDRAVAVMRRLVSETGGDAETFAILGRIYKHRWKAGSDPRDLDAAIEYYVAGFEREPADFYTGFNAVTLMFIRGDASNSERFAALFAKVKELVRAQIGPDRTQDYWVNNIAMELAVIERDWQAAQSSLDLALATRPPAFARAAAAESLERLGHRMSGGDAAWIERLVAQLRSTGDADKDDA